MEAARCDLIYVAKTACRLLAIVVTSPGNGGAVLPQTELEIYASLDSDEVGYAGR